MPHALSIEGWEAVWRPCAGLRKTNPGAAAVTAAPSPAVDALKPAANARLAAKKRKSVRFNIPCEGKCHVPAAAPSCLH